MLTPAPLPHAPPTEIISPITFLAHCLVQSGTAPNFQSLAMTLFLWPWAYRPVTKPTIFVHALVYIQRAVQSSKLDPCAVKAMFVGLPHNQKGKGRGKGWSNPEVMSMLDCIESHLRLGTNQWDAVQADYNSRIEQNNGWVVRDTESMRRKFKSLRNSKKPTGDPDCPENVKCTKRINRAMEARMSVLDMGSGDENKDNENNVNNDSDSSSDPLSAPTPLANSEQTMSQKAQRRRRIDEILADSAENEAIKGRLVFEQRDARQHTFEVLAARQELQQAMELEYRQYQMQLAAERDEREAKLWSDKK
ncbi:hypothetical protein H257_04793 [Aphanomyces astaci]|uniref:DUF6818 domain-containing protein n=1 Tax=Aphanomyces astaci TaxID=112090 RepID=W4GTK5_APHAT|nr:hypothetical protein H257_04793 [Aphanomyces astaci]ETV83050.1 hypothetical protein H257_04793 [Aphanomyces astaci]|eukprot:XP_009827721.1 hypothetical protein H257_04793 [Aphanomyces astaci]